MVENIAKREHGTRLSTNCNKIDSQSFAKDDLFKWEDILPMDSNHLWERVSKARQVSIFNYFSYWLSILCYTQFVDIPVGSQHCYSPQLMLQHFHDQSRFHFDRRHFYFLGGCRKRCQQFSIYLHMNQLLAFLYFFLLQQNVCFEDTQEYSERLLYETSQFW